MTSYLLSGPASEPVALDEARAYLRLDDTDEDALLTTLVTAARLHVESVTGLALLSQSWRVVRDDWPVDGTICLPVAPVQSVAAVVSHVRSLIAQRRRAPRVVPGHARGLGGETASWSRRSFRNNRRAAS